MLKKLIVKCEQLILKCIDFNAYSPTHIDFLIIYVSELKQYYDEKIIYEVLKETLHLLYQSYTGILYIFILNHDFYR
jgi:hypothetical protein